MYGRDAPKGFHRVLERNDRDNMFSKIFKFIKTKIGFKSKDCISGYPAISKDEFIYFDEIVEIYTKYCKENTDIEKFESSNGLSLHFLQAMHEALSGKE